MNNSCRRITHCIFDVDGTLLDTETLYTKAIQTTLDEYGKTYDWEIKKSLMGLTNEKTAEKIVEIYSLPITPQEYLKRYTEVTHRLMAHAQLLPGVRRLVCHLHSCKIPLAIATGSSENMLDMKMNDHRDLLKLFHHAVCASTDKDVKNGKPAPDIFQVTASRFDEKPCPENCLVFEDAPNGVQAAHAAGMSVVMIPDKHIPESDCTLASQVLNSLLDFRPEEFGLPAFPSSCFNRQ